jgi:hypothetical protein
VPTKGLVATQRYVLGAVFRGRGSREAERELAPAREWAGALRRARARGVEPGRRGGRELSYASVSLPFTTLKFLETPTEGGVVMGSPGLRSA